MKYRFAAIFTEDEGGGYVVQFHDMPNIVTGGVDVAKADFMAYDALGMMLRQMEDDGDTIPAPTPIENIPLEDNQLVRLIDIDTDEYRADMQRFRENPIKYARQKSGMSITELANYLHAPRRTIQDWDNGKHLPPHWIAVILYDHIVGN